MTTAETTRTFPATPADVTGGLVFDCCRRLERARTRDQELTDQASRLRRRLSEYESVVALATPESDFGQVAIAQTAIPIIKRSLEVGSASRRQSDDSVKYAEGEVSVAWARFEHLRDVLEGRRRPDDLPTDRARWSHDDIETEIRRLVGDS